MHRESFAHLYDAYISYYKDDISFWRTMVEMVGSPVLELGCGTGRVMIELARHGFQVEGIDSDPAMLEIAHSKLFPAYKELVHLHLGDMRNFSLTTQFQLILIPCNTFAYFNESECQSILRCSKEHLLQKGHLVMELPNPETISPSNASTLLEDETELISAFLSPRTNHPVQVSARRLAGPEKDVTDIAWYYDILFPDGTVRRFDQVLRYHLRSAPALKQLLEQEGFTLIEILGEYDLSTYAPEAERILITGRKSSS